MSDQTTLALTDEDGTIIAVFNIDSVVAQSSVVVSDCGDHQMILRSVQRVEDKKYRDRSWLVEQYINEERTMQEIGDMFGVSPMTIYTWLNKFDIPTRARGRRQ